MQELFTQLTHAVEGTWSIALAAAFIWGILSVLLSPCHLAGIPLIVGFISQQKNNSHRRDCALASLFAAGILITIIIIGLITAAAGRMLGDLGPWCNYFVAAIFFIVGLHLLGVIPSPFAGPSQVKLKQKGLLAAFILGLIFGLALGPCTFAYMAPMLAITFRMASTNLPYGILLLLTYAIGHCTIIIIAGTSTSLVQKYLNWNDKSHTTQIIQKICAILIIAAGLWLIHTAP